MDKDRIEEIGKEITGSIKEGISKVTGNKRLANED
jgi:uncharacterized protein YjbJ (UPF0337 family)